jgi:phosphoribosylaminoimidazolecarboxamide formyltransferase/IMP cyclohydrolase
VIPVSAFGGIVSCNFKVNKKLALELQKLFLEVIIGNNFDAEALKILRKKKNLRLIDASKFYPNEVLKFTSTKSRYIDTIRGQQSIYKKRFQGSFKEKTIKVSI